ncbi:uncharacterized protein LOC110019704 [Phalaenopsis equestris]|uniref:uncharacterized protein LOC110019704 n=1 Tax=Phalaenopsis equestris TaxID=78828 RepID=UPI0009E36958|nr:uncharacterized protein LOC110019704 [Phalaenopsis equestris]
MSGAVSNAKGKVNGQRNKAKDDHKCCFQMPLHYPRYTKAEYEDMPEWKLDRLFEEYGLPAIARDLDGKRKFAVGAFIWLHQ